MTVEKPNPNFLSDEDGVFAAEVSLSADEQTMLTLDYSLDHDSVLLTVLKGDQDIHLEMAPSDIPRLEEALDRCKKRVASEQEALRADADGAADCS